jgi:hypothetical protein
MNLVSAKLYPPCRSRRINEPFPESAERKAEVDRIRMSVHEIANSGLTLPKLSVAASLLGDLVKQ